MASARSCIEPNAPGIAAAVAAWAPAEPDAVAVIDGGVTLSRRDLLTWSGDLAAVFERLARREVAEGPFLWALLLPRSWRWSWTAWPESGRTRTPAPQPSRAT